MHHFLSVGSFHMYLFLSDNVFSRWEWTTQQLSLIPIQANYKEYPV